MSAPNFDVGTVVLGPSVDLQNPSAVPLATSTSFTERLSPISQLSAPSTEKSKYAGLLYAPAISTGCVEQRPESVANLTLANLPIDIAPSPDMQSRGLIAMAPTTGCTDSYIYQAIQDRARAVILYPASSTDSINLPLHSIARSGSIPIYTITWQNSDPLIKAMNQYNTDLLHVPNGVNLSMTYPADQYVRLFMIVNRNAARSLPGLWIFLLIVLGLLCLIVAVTSLALVSFHLLKID